MNYKIEIKNVTPLILAAVREVIPLNKLSIKIPENLNKVYGFLASNGIDKFSHNAALYLDDKPTVDTGVILFSKFENNGNIICSQTPEGKVAYTLHTGSYYKLPVAHKEIQDWCRDNRKELSGRCWEIYGDWSDDESKLTTEVFYLLNGE